MNDSSQTEDSMINQAIKTNNWCDDPVPVIDVILSPPKYVQDATYGLGVFESVDLEGNVFLYKFKHPDRDMYHTEEAITFKILPPKI